MVMHTSIILTLNSKTKMEIICPVHGSFWMTPSHHIQGQKCPRCKGLYKTTDEFIKEAREIHGDKYDYSKTEYNGSHNKVCIICPKHGEFWQMAKDHLRGQGALSVALMKRGKNVDVSLQKILLKKQGKCMVTSMTILKLTTKSQTSRYV